MIYRRLMPFMVATLLVLTLLLSPGEWQVGVAAQRNTHPSLGSRPVSLPSKHAPLYVQYPTSTRRLLAGRPLPPTKQQSPPYGQRIALGRAPSPTIEPYVRPEFASEMCKLRPTITAAAHRHNRQELSHMSDHEFAVTIALLLYNEHFGWLEEQVLPLRAFTPLYEDLQTQANEIGGNLSVWPSNLRPSVAIEILSKHVPIPSSTHIITVPVEVYGSKIDIDTYSSQSALYAAINEEITQPQLATEYLAANLERGLYRAQFEGLRVTWRMLAAWHNQGVVAPEDIQANPTARDYVRRTSAYLATAYALFDTPSCGDLNVELLKR